MKKVFLLLMLVVIALPISAQQQDKKIFVTRDAKGNLVFSDSPQLGAEEVTLTSRPNIVPATDPNFPNTKEPKTEQYEVSIIQPEDQGTVRDNTGSVYVSGQISPMFKRGLRVRLLVDGQSQSEPQNNTVFILRDIERGEHKLQLELLDQSGKLIATSPITTFYLHRASQVKAN
ncbi:DUF4124 domain-containing protein [Rheinheimera sp. MMS21-TC3]|uniref:DUF4124 domain-containing protein n=1 Tax=Rheinheimera sp. MMS21-TC3 TaxID=3072790 RepID=UPI0028C44FF3|nr:DUF4124 domain-containing protein [Rheinheimera sp. MMS21-TC3]WNO60400.1 DUF4124 domain-containing protein [Rheinheimera sp. MMS21-TC3]